MRINQKSPTTMRVPSNSTCSLLTLGVIIISLAGVLFAPSTAQAGCGEHVVVSLPPEKKLPISAPSLPEAPAKKQVPCSGPHCTRSPFVPTPAPAVPVTMSGPDAAQLLEPLLLPASRSTTFLGEDSCEHPQFSSSGIYHPPR